MPCPAQKKHFLRRCPTELPVVAPVHIRTVLCGGHQLHAVTEHLKCSQCCRGTDFLILTFNSHIMRQTTYVAGIFLRKSHFHLSLHLHIFKISEDRVSQAQHNQTTFRVGAVLHTVAVGSFPGLYPLEAGSNAPAATIKKSSSTHCQISPGGDKTAPN